MLKSLVACSHSILEYFILLCYHAAILWLPFVKKLLLPGEWRASTSGVGGCTLCNVVYVRDHHKY